jgi:SAM-dependent methyltransferase
MSSPTGAGQNASKRSNLEYWKQLQDAGYFEAHSCYGGLKDINPLAAVDYIEPFVPLTDKLKVVVIGCGYGRETVGLAPRVAHVWGIDVNTTILDKAVAYLRERGILNFTPVEAAEFKTAIPDGIDLVFSVVVMQHLTKDLVRDYFKTLAQKLAPGGHFVVQFLEDLARAPGSDDADTSRIYEPSVSWTAPEIVALARFANLQLVEMRTRLVTPTSLWHFACLRK